MNRFIATILLTVFMTGCFGEAQPRSGSAHNGDPATNNGGSSSGGTSSGGANPNDPAEAAIDYQNAVVGSFTLCARVLKDGKPLTSAAGLLDSYFTFDTKSGNTIARNGEISIGTGSSSTDKAYSDEIAGKGYGCRSFVIGMKAVGDQAAVEGGAVCPKASPQDATSREQLCGYKVREIVEGLKILAGSLRSDNKPIDGKIKKFKIYKQRNITNYSDVPVIIIQPEIYVDFDIDNPNQVSPGGIFDYEVAALYKMFRKGPNKTEKRDDSKEKVVTKPSLPSEKSQRKRDADIPI